MQPFKCVSITGPQGSGKSTVATALANLHGSYYVEDQQRSRGMFNDYMLHDTVIFDECSDYKMIEKLAGQNFIKVCQLNEDDQIVPMPRLIFIMGAGFKSPDDMPNIHIFEENS